MSNLDQQRGLAPLTPLPSKQALDFDTKDKHWLNNPVSMSQLKRAVEKKSPTVVLNGIEYNITYGIYTNLKVSGENREGIKLKRKDGVMAPFGYVSMKRINQFEFEGDD